MEGWNPLIAQLAPSTLVRRTASSSLLRHAASSSSLVRRTTNPSSFSLYFIFLLLPYSASTPGQIIEFLSNSHKLVWNNHNGFEEDEDKNSERIRVGAEALAAIPEREPRGVVSKEDAAVALRVVLTNAVKVQDQEGRALKIAVFGPTFSWINHSCSAHACYPFSISSPSSSASNSFEESKLRIAPFACSSCETEIDNGVCSNSSEFAKEEGKQGYGPRLTVRSIKRIEKGEKVTVAYTYLFQPKACFDLLFS